MTLATWKAEFYPTDASECGQADAIEHSLRKWRGLRAEALGRHGLAVAGGDIFDRDGDLFCLDSTNCALCERFYDEPAGSRCRTCPLAISRGGAACVDETDSETSSPWRKWSHHDDPEPMIAALEKAQKEPS